MILRNKESLIRAANEAFKSNIVAIDTETLGLEDKTMVGFSFAYTKTNGRLVSYYVPVRHKYIENAKHTDYRIALALLLNTQNIIFHNAAFDLEVLHQEGMDIRAIKKIHDTVALAHLSDERIRHGLKPLTKRIFKHEMTEFKELCSTGKKAITFAEVVHEDAIDQYASEDAYYTYKLYKYFMPIVMSDDGLKFIYEEIEQPLFKIVANMHINGIQINKDKVDEIRKLCESKIELAQAKIDTMMPNVNLNSPKQMREWFISYRHLEPLSFSKRTGQPSVNKEFLKHYKNDKRCPEIKPILTYKKYNKILSTFIPALTPGIDGRIYAKFRQNSTLAGRFSSASPNVQNIPRDSEEMDIREVVIAYPGQVLVGADYSQIELRVTAHFSKDKNLCSIYNLDNGDVHQMTADACGCTRQEAKTLNFGLIYGMHEKALAKQLKTTVPKARNYYHKYWKQYPGVLEFMQQTEKNAMKVKHVRTGYGRKRRLSQYFGAMDEWQKGGELRSLVNAVIQGTSADIMKYAMVKMAPKLRELGGRIILTVHDEVLVSCPPETAIECGEIIEASMIEAAEILSVPVKADVRWGLSWAQVHGDDGIKKSEVKEWLNRLNL
ncbi:MAG: DNA polymerase [Bacteroidales bacterium]